MLVHRVAVRRRRLSCPDRDIVQHGVNSDAVEPDLDGEWIALERVTLVFSKGGVSSALPWRGEPVPVPFELMEEPGRLYLTVVGRTGSDVRVATERMADPFRVVECGDLDGTYEPGDPALDEVQQAIADANAAAGAANEAAERATAIGCGPTAPAVGGKAGDLYIDYVAGTLWKYEEG